MWILLTGVFPDLLQGAVVASDFSYRTTSPWDDQRGSSLGLAVPDPMEGVLATLALAKKTPVEALFLIFSCCGDGFDVGRYFPILSLFLYCFSSLTFIFHEATI